MSRLSDTELDLVAYHYGTGTLTIEMLSSVLQELRGYRAAAKRPILALCVTCKVEPQCEAGTYCVKCWPETYP